MMILVLAASFGEAHEWAISDGLKLGQWRFAQREKTVCGFCGQYVRLESFVQHPKFAEIIVQIRLREVCGFLHQRPELVEVDWRPTEMIPEDYYAG